MGKRREVTVVVVKSDREIATVVHQIASMPAHVLVLLESCSEFSRQISVAMWAWGIWNTLLGGGLAPPPLALGCGPRPHPHITFRILNT